MYCITPSEWQIFLVQAQLNMRFLYQFLPYDIRAVTGIYSTTIKQLYDLYFGIISHAQNQIAFKQR